MSLARLLCRLLGHRPLRGVSPNCCIVYHCVRCGSLAHGRYGVTR